MANYFDTTHIDGKKLMPEEIGDAIRHKKFGVDVREAMAQGLEYCMRQAQKVDTLETEVKNLDERVTSLETLPNEVTKIEQDIVDINRDITKLKTAVFGDGAIPIDDPVFEDNHDKRAQEVHLD
ncbi:hypothetical protein [Lactobacillus taiwanensis]|uniref:hypothetical protein n=1 Tax=Lactobacillus taiwanensis TaxID=508451 RepID=UPI000B98D7ED|nr:hypothetical protein [Lactobacillus taiwanensis]OYR97468.1 hypothetical protein CBF51_03125 [Lactobacillus taiwanensis]OYS01979.1 hypothetical protein CBF61_04005 [Lactobacillus taiwanensis]OYS14848.1 hypothetical protein CBF69_07070 [Lactobacillus taiwanensis]OYS31823.1 hypothetical protein CBF75_06460 [Lactobacillus taiwanensis]OYS33620.1 hypothetical protein CBF78_05370 [Lactobacillus taiwanensis]